MSKKKSKRQSESPPFVGKPKGVSVSNSAFTRAAVALGQSEWGAALRAAKANRLAAMGHEGQNLEDELMDSLHNEEGSESGHQTSISPETLSLALDQGALARSPTPELSHALAATMGLFLNQARLSQEAPALNTDLTDSRIGSDASLGALSALVEQASQWGLFETALSAAQKELAENPDFLTARFALLPAFLSACSDGPAPLIYRDADRCAQRLTSLARAEDFWSAYQRGERELAPHIAQSVNIKSFYDRSLGEAIGSNLALAFKSPAVSMALSELTDRIFNAELDSEFPISWSKVAAHSSQGSLLPLDNRADVFDALPSAYWLSALSHEHEPESSSSFFNWVLQSAIRAAADPLRDASFSSALASQLATFCHQQGLCQLEILAPGALERAGADWGQTRFEYDLNEGLYEMTRSSETDHGAWARPALAAANAAFTTSDLIAGQSALGMAALIQAKLVSDSIFEADRAPLPLTRSTPPKAL